MSEPVRISVIVPALNEEKLIGRNLRAFSPELRRRFGIELIVSDGGSHDRTLEIAAELADLVVRHVPGERPTAARQRNAGARHARGAALVFIDADSYPADPERFAQTALDVLVEFASGRLVASACPVEIGPDERGLIDRVFHACSNHGIALSNRFLMGMGRGPCQVIDRSVFESLGGYRDDFAAAEDNELFQRLARRGKVGFFWGLKVYESPRRYRRYGYARVLAIWLVNAAFQLTRGRPRSDEWEAIR